MSILLGGTASPVGWVVCFIEALMEQALDDVLTWRKGLGQNVSTSRPTPFPMSLRLLEPLESPWTTELLMPCGRWTAYLNNDRDGGDPSSAATQIARRLDIRCVVAMHSPRYGPGHAGTQMWLLSPGGMPPRKQIRIIAAVATDGRWSWQESGAIQYFEDPARYQQRSIRRRFDRALLVQYLAALGIDIDNPASFGSGISVRQTVDWATVKESPSQARKRLNVDPSR